MDLAEWKHDVFQDWSANVGSGEAKLITAAFRQAARWRRAPGRPWHGLAVALYTIIVGWILSVELPPETEVGPGLRILHPYAIVINKDSRIGCRCMIRASTTLGNVVRSDGSESGSPVIGDDVELGVGVIILGDVTIGDRAKIGAGSVVIKDVPPDTVAVGNPARILDRSGSAG